MCEGYGPCANAKENSANHSQGTRSPIRNRNRQVVKNHRTAAINITITANVLTTLCGFRVHKNVLSFDRGFMQNLATLSPCRGIVRIRPVVCLDSSVQALRHGGGEREEASLRVQAAGTGCAEVRLTLLHHGPPAAALIFQFRDAPRPPTWGCWVAREHAWCTNNDKNDDSVRFRSAF